MFYNYCYITLGTNRRPLLKQFLVCINTINYTSFSLQKKIIQEEGKQKVLVECKPDMLLFYILIDSKYNLKYGFTSANLCFGVKDAILLYYKQYKPKQYIGLHYNIEFCRNVDDKSGRYCGFEISTSNIFEKYIKLPEEIEVFNLNKGYIKFKGNMDTVIEMINDTEAQYGEQFHKFSKVLSNKYYRGKKYLNKKDPIYSENEYKEIRYANATADKSTRPEGRVTYGFRNETKTIKQMENEYYAEKAKELEKTLARKDIPEIVKTKAIIEHNKEQRKRKHNELQFTYGDTTKKRRTNDEYNASTSTARKITEYDSDEEPLNIKQDRLVKQMFYRDDVDYIAINGKIMGFDLTTPIRTKVNEYMLYFSNKDKCFGINYIEAPGVRNKIYNPKREKSKAPKYYLKSKFYLKVLDPNEKFYTVGFYNKDKKLLGQMFYNENDKKDKKNKIYRVRIKN